MSESMQNLLDWTVLFSFFYFLFYHLYPLLLFNAQVVTDAEDQLKLFWYMMVFFSFMIYGGFVQLNGRHIVMWNSVIQAGSFLWDTFQRLMRTVRNFIPQFLLTPARYLHRYLSAHVMYHHVNVILGYLIIFCCVVLFLLAFYNAVLGTEAFTFFSQHCLLVLLYFACSSFAFRKEYTVTILLNRFAYICLHVGYVCRSLRYEGSHYIVIIGSATLILSILFYFLNYPIDGESFHENPPPGHSPGNPPPEHQPQKPLKKPQFKSPKQKGKKRR